MKRFKELEALRRRAGMYFGDPRFAGPTKDELIAIEVADVVERLLDEALSTKQK